MSEKSNFDASKELDKIKKDQNLMAVAGGALAVVVGLFIPWYSVEIFGISTSVSPGLNSTGIILLVCAVVALGASLNVLSKDKKTMNIVAVIAAVLALLVMFSNWPDDDLGQFVSTGIGYWLGFLGSIAMIVGTVRRKMGDKGSSKPSDK